MKDLYSLIEAHPSLALAGFRPRVMIRLQGIHKGRHRAHLSSDVCLLTRRSLDGISMIRKRAGLAKQVRVCPFTNIASESPAEVHLWSAYSELAPLVAQACIIKAVGLRCLAAQLRSPSSLAYVSHHQQPPALGLTRASWQLSSFCFYHPSFPIRWCRSAGSIWTARNWKYAQENSASQPE